MGIKFIISHVLCDCNRRDLCNKECSLFIERCSVVSLADNIKTPAVAVQNMLEKTPHSVSRMRYLNHVHLALLQSLKGLPVLCSQKKACIYKSELFHCIFKITFDTIFFIWKKEFQKVFANCRNYNCQVHLSALDIFLYKEDHISSSVAAKITNWNIAATWHFLIRAPEQK